jgi:FkbM family methyltransferase
MFNFHINNFTILDSIHGKFIVNRHSAIQAETLIKTGSTHMESELLNMKSIIDTLSEGCVAIDAGANIGIVSIPLSNWTRPKNGIVHSFEVQRMLYYALCGAVALNDIDNLIVHNYGLGDLEKILKVPKQNYKEPKDFGMVSLKNQADVTLFEAIEIKTIDSLKLSRLDFLKIDVEGMEIEVLTGGRETIRQYRPWCWIEYWMVDKNLLKHEFEGLNYSIYVMDQLNVLCAPVEKLIASGLQINAPLF